MEIPDGGGKVKLTEKPCPMVWYHSSGFRRIGPVRYSYSNTPGVSEGNRRSAIPASLHKTVREVAKKEGVSINQVITTALAEKLSALMTAEYLEERAKRGSRRKFERAMGKVKDVKPADQDKA